MFTARRAIEAAVIEQVIARVTSAEIIALRRLVREEEAAQRGDRAGGLGSHWDFIIAWASCAAIRCWFAT
jgi:DNA-binding GntR family transcriptional regulator